MKAKLLAAFLTLGVSQASIATMNYNGWAVGVDGGWVNYSNKMQRDNQPNMGKTMTFNSAIMGAHADFHKSAPNNLYTGLSFGVGYHAGTPSQTAGTLTNGAVINAKRKPKFYSEVAGRLGMNYANSIAYALIALKCTWAKYESSGSVNTNTTKYSESHSSTKTIWGVAPGAGFDIKVAKNWSLGAEYRYFFDQDHNFNGGKYKNQNAHNVIGRVSYHF